MRQRIKGRTQRVHIGIVGNVHEGSRRGDDPSLGGQIRQVTEGLHRLHGDDHVCPMQRDEVAGNGLAADAQIALHVAAALAHAVHLCLFDIEVLVHGGFTDDGGYAQNALAAYATEDNICFHSFKPLSI